MPNQNKKVLNPFCHKNIFDRKWSFLHSFSIKNIFYDKMDLVFFYFDVAKWILADWKLKLRYLDKQKIAQSNSKQNLKGIGFQISLVILSELKCMVYLLFLLKSSENRRFFIWFQGEHKLIHLNLLNIRDEIWRENP